MARIFVTGSTGFIGSHLVELLVKKDHEVICLVRKTSNLQWIRHLRVKYCYGSLFNPDSYESELVNNEYIVHLAGVTKAGKAEAFYQGNYSATKLLLETVHRVNKFVERFLFVSSQAAAGPSPTPEPIDEDYPCQPITAYGHSKMKAEQIVHRYREEFPVTIIRPPAVFGPKDRDVLHFFRSIQSGFNLMVGDVDQLVSLIYVEDLVEGICRAVFSEQAANKIYFMCHRKPYYWSELADTTARIMNKNYRTVNIPYYLAYFIALFLEGLAGLTGKSTILNREKMQEIKQPYWVVSPDRAATDLNFVANGSINDALKRTIDWYKNHNWMR